MLASRRGFAIAGTTGSALAMLAACSNSHGRGDTQPSASVLPSNQQEGAPYPADMEHPAVQGAVDDQLGGGVQVLHRRYGGLEGVGDQGRVGADESGGGGLGHAVELGEQLLGQVVAQVGQGQAHAQEQPQHPAPEGRQGTGGVNGLAHARNLTPRDSRATIHDDGLFLVELA